MKKQRLSTIVLSTALLLSACSADTTAEESVTAGQTTTDSTEKLTIVATSFYEYDWAREILGEEQGNFNLVLLNDNGVDIHSYEPSVEDISTISSADLLLYTGGESDTWVDDILIQPMNEALVALSMSDILADRVLFEVAVEGMQETEHSHSHDDEEETDDHDHEDEAVESDDHDHDHEDESVEADDHDHDHEDESVEADDHDHEDEEVEQDEHVWLSLENAMIICEVLADELGQLDAEHAEVYRTNADAYIATLGALAESYETMVASASSNTVLFADRFPFLYLMNDYGIEYYAAFQGCSAETEASFETIIFLAEKINELELNYIFIIDNGLEDLATTIIANSQNPDCQILELDSMQSTTQSDMDAGATYYNVMEQNLEILALALGE